MAIKHTGTKFKTEISFLNNFVHRVKFKNPSDSCLKVCVGYQMGWFRTRYILALQYSTFNFFLNFRRFYLRDVALGGLSFRSFVVQEVCRIRTFVVVGCLSVYRVNVRLSYRFSASLLWMLSSLFSKEIKIFVKPKKNLFLIS